MKSKKNLIGHPENVIESYKNRRDADFEKLTISDANILSEIDILLKQLSEDGREYWQTYYG